MLFLGNIEAKIDAKGRAFLPASFRKVLQSAGEEHLVLRCDVYQPCITLYPESAWSLQLDMLRAKLNRWNDHHQQVLRKFMEGVETVTLDASGRLLLPKKHLEAVGIGLEVRFLGMGDYIEIWKNTGESFMDQDDFKAAMSKLMNDKEDSTP